MRRISKSHQLSAIKASRLMRWSSNKSAAGKLGSTTTSRLVAASTPNSTWQILSALTTQQQQRLFSSRFSSFAEPDPLAFFKKSNAADSAKDDESTPVDPDETLRNDIRTMGSLLGEVLKEHHGSDLFENVENMRLLAKKWRESGCTDQEAFDYLTSFASQLSDEELFSVSRSFTHFLAIVNAAEAHHRVRRLKQVTLESDKPCGALNPHKDSMGGVIPNLLEKGYSKEDILHAIANQTCEFVLTAHPTEVNRRTILDKNRRIQHILTEADRYRSLSSHGKNVGNEQYEQKELHAALAREITSTWLSDEVSRAKPTPEMEAIKGTLVLETVLWKTVPEYLRRLDATCQEFLDERLPLSAAPIKFASWMGGDRDGNPNVKPDTTRQVCMRNRFKAAELFFEDMKQLHNRLSIRDCSDELRAVVGDAREPYRKHLDHVIHKLFETKNWAEQELKIMQGRVKMPTVQYPKEELYLDQNEFMEDLLLIHRSLNETGRNLLADGLLTDILRNVSAFGLTLVPLDVRQESGRHEEAVDAITRYLGLGSYAQWDEETKISWLTSQIASKRPLLRKGIWNEHPEMFSETVCDTLEIQSMIADQHQGSLGAYVISQATSASDVLAVLLLQIDAGVKKPLRIAPLFETLSDLNGAVDTMRTLFSLPTYMGIINGKQEVMIGYSDSAKDAGRLAAVWAQYGTQEKLAKLAKDFNIDMTFFHGKGGTVGRGGNPQTFEGIMAHAPNTINGYFRVTEQGEMINQNFGYKDRAQRTLDIYSAAILGEKFQERPVVKPEWKELMDDLSDISCEAYRKVVRGDERFVPYFHEATPNLTDMNIGSRPAKRNPGGGVESLRAIPWNFAWTQTRLNLPTWLGVGQAFGSTLKSERAGVLREMYRDWPTFRTMVDLVEMVLAKSDPAIAKHYEDMLVTKDSAKELGHEVREFHVDTEKNVLELTGHSTLAENNVMLSRALKVKNPYVDCLNVLQAESLKRLKQCDEDNKPQILRDALSTTITGIANGMGNTG